MNQLVLAIILQLVGVAVIIAEIILPSGGLLSLIAAGVLGYSLYIVFTGVSGSAGMMFVIVDIIAIPILVIVGLKVLAKSPVTLREQLSSDAGVSSQSPELEKYINKGGRTLTHLHPAGIALIDGKRLDVVSRGEFISKDTEVEVISVTGNQIIVRDKEVT